MTKGHQCVGWTSKTARGSGFGGDAGDHLQGLKKRGHGLGVGSGGKGSVSATLRLNWYWRH